MHRSGIGSAASDRATSAVREVGLDARYGVTAGLNLDLTLNTDFAQVEVDEQQVNLTRFGLFYPEKRDFFLENSNFLHHGDGSAFTSAQVQTDLFFSRRIGLSDSGQPVAILGGAQLAGKSGANSIGILDLQTDSGFGDNFFVSRPILGTLRDAVADTANLAYAWRAYGFGSRRNPLSKIPGVNHRLGPRPAQRQSSAASGARR